MNIFHTSEIWAFWQFERRRNCVSLWFSHKARSFNFLSWFIQLSERGLLYFTKNNSTFKSSSAALSYLSNFTCRIVRRLSFIEIFFLSLSLSLSSLLFISWHCDERAIIFHRAIVRKNCFSALSLALFVETLRLDENVTRIMELIRALIKSAAEQKEKLYIKNYYYFALIKAFAFLFFIFRRRYMTIPHTGYCCLGFRVFHWGEKKETFFPTHKSSRASASYNQNERITF